MRRAKHDIATSPPPNVLDSHVIFSGDQSLDDHPAPAVERDGPSEANNHDH
jgi:hypothetical protein